MGDRRRVPRRHVGRGDRRARPRIDPVVPAQHRGDRRAASDDARAPGASARRRGSLRRAKRLGFSDVRIADARRRERRTRCASSARRAGIARRLQDGRHLRRRVRGAHAVPLLDLRGRGRERGARRRKKIMILGGGPNRIGQGIEFDYCCVHAAFALREDGFETIMVNCNPETVSTDYDTSDRLYFEPLTLEDVLAIVAPREAGRRDRAVRRADAAQARGAARSAPACRSSAPAPTRSTAPRTASASARCCARSACCAPRTASRAPQAEAIAIADRIGYPVLVRPSYVLGGRAMEIVYEPHELERYVRARRRGLARPAAAHRPLPRGRDRGRRRRGERRPRRRDRRRHGAHRGAGVHSGDSACALPPIVARRRRCRTRSAARRSRWRASSASSA